MHVCLHEQAVYLLTYIPALVDLWMSCNKECTYVTAIALIVRTYPYILYMYVVRRTLCLVAVLCWVMPVCRCLLLLDRD